VPELLEKAGNVLGQDFLVFNDQQEAMVAVLQCGGEGRQWQARARRRCRAPGWRLSAIWPPHCVDHALDQRQADAQPPLLVLKKGGTALAHVILEMPGRCR
jgi:hypothetical protein